VYLTAVDRVQQREQAIWQCDQTNCRWLDDYDDDNNNINNNNTVKNRITISNTHPGTDRKCFFLL